jgi:hypothetical protein
MSVLWIADASRHAIFELAAATSCRGMYESVDLPRTVINRCGVTVAIRKCGCYLNPGLGTIQRRLGQNVRILVPFHPSFSRSIHSHTQMAVALCHSDLAHWNYVGDGNYRLVCSSTNQFELALMYRVRLRPNREYKWNMSRVRNADTAQLINTAFACYFNFSRRISQATV